MGPWQGASVLTGNHRRCQSSLQLTRGREYAVALVAKAVAIGSDRNGGLGGQAVGNDHVGGAGIVDIQNKDDRRGSWKAINQFITDPELHWKIPYLICGAKFKK